MNKIERVFRNEKVQTNSKGHVFTTYHQNPKAQGQKHQICMCSLLEFMIRKHFKYSKFFKYHKISLISFFNFFYFVLRNIMCVPLVAVATV